MSSLEMPASNFVAKRYTLTELLSSLQRCIDRYYNRLYYVTGEVSGCRGRSQRGHCYFNLIDKTSDPLHPELGGGELSAQISAVIWSSRYNQIAQHFQQVTGQPLTDGIKILALVELKYDPRYGLQLDIQDIDPSYTLGEVARQRRETLQLLERMGLMERNKQHPMPRPLRRIAVISSPTAAGYQDFMRHLEESAVAPFIEKVLFRATMQGKSAPQSIVAALERVRQHETLFDLVVIIRGGGATADLGTFDDFAVARAVAEFSLPVWSGIGHDRDESVVDLVSHKAFKTPTAVATAVIDAWCAEYTLLEEAHQRLERSWLEARQTAQTGLERLAQLLRQTTLEQLHREERQMLLLREQLSVSPHTLLRNQHTLLESQRERLASAARYLPMRYQLQWETLLTQFKHRYASYLTAQLNEWQARQQSLQEHLKITTTQRTQIEHLAQIIRAMDPQTVLQRGYAIVHHKGELVKKPSQLREGDDIELRLAEGTLSATLSQLKEP